MLILQNLTYFHPNRELLFDRINLVVNAREKLALIGINGSGKSTLLRIIAGELKSSSGQCLVSVKPYYVPQIFGQYKQTKIAEALKVQDKILALNAILSGAATEENLELLKDDWTIEQRCREALNRWDLKGVDLLDEMGNLSGGEKTRVMLSGLLIHQPELVMLDEPSNHLDLKGRKMLYDYVQSTSSTLLVVSHDRILLNLLDRVCELSQSGISNYGGNYDFYLLQKQEELNALSQDIQVREKALRKAEGNERETLGRQQKMDSRGKKKSKKSGMARIAMNTLRNQAERSTSRLKKVHEGIIGNLFGELQELRASLPDEDRMRFGFYDSALHKGKVLFKGTAINHSYGAGMLWPDDLNIHITSGERIAIKGSNGSGKTTLIKLILGRLEPGRGQVFRGHMRSVYIDQDYSLIKNKLKVFEQALEFNTGGLQEHEVKIRLNRFLFGPEVWDKPCAILSGGERMRLMLCCLTLFETSPDIIVLDEPTNNLDIQNIEILTAAINKFQGTLVAVSHDETFLKEVTIERFIQL